MGGFEESLAGWGGLVGRAGKVSAASFSRQARERCAIDFRMAKVVKKSRISHEARVLGDRTFAAITAVEGIGLSAESRNRLASLKRENLSAQEQRAAVIHAYSERKASR